VPFRGSTGEARPYLPTDPFARFVALQEALTADAGWLADRTPMRLAAVTLLTTPGQPQELKQRLEALDAGLSEQLGWLSGVAGPVRLVLSALLLKYGDEPTAFLSEAARVRELLRAVRAKPTDSYLLFTALILRRVLQGAPAQAQHAERIAALYAEMKRHHWWLTGSEDLPACAMLMGQPGDARAIGDRVEEIYQALRNEAGLSRGDPLQTCANILFLTGLQPTEVARRFALLQQALSQRGQSIGSREYDEVASLCFLALPVDRVAQTVVDFRDRLRQSVDSMSKPLAFSLAAAIAFVYLAGHDETMKQLGDVKALLDMQAIVAAQQAAVMVAVTVAAT
jgi:hypothetical protein